MFLSVANRARAARAAGAANRPRTTDRAAMRRLVLFAVAAACFGTARGEWQNLTVFHTNQANYSAGDIADMNTADDLVSARPRPAALSAPQIACLAGIAVRTAATWFSFLLLEGFVPLSQAWASAVELADWKTSRSSGIQP